VITSQIEKSQATRLGATPVSPDGSHGGPTFVHRACATKTHRLLYHSTLGLRVIKTRRETEADLGGAMLSKEIRFIFDFSEPEIYSSQVNVVGREGLVGTVLNLITTTLHKCAAVPRRARIEGS